MGEWMVPIILSCTTHFERKKSVAMPYLFCEASVFQESVTWTHRWQSYTNEEQTAPSDGKKSPCSTATLCPSKAGLQERTWWNSPNEESRKVINPILTDNRNVFTSPNFHLGCKFSVDEDTHSQPGNDPPWHLPVVSKRPGPEPKGSERPELQEAWDPRRRMPGAPADLRASRGTYRRGWGDGEAVEAEHGVGGECGLLEHREVWWWPARHSADVRRILRGEEATQTRPSLEAIGEAWHSSIFPGSP